MHGMARGLLAGALLTATACGPLEAPTGDMETRGKADTTRPSEEAFSLLKPEQASGLVRYVRATTGKDGAHEEIPKQLFFDGNNETGKHALYEDGDSVVVTVRFEQPVFVSRIELSIAEGAAAPTSAGIYETYSCDAYREEFCAQGSDDSTCDCHKDDAFVSIPILRDMRAPPKRDHVLEEVEGWIIDPALLEGTRATDTVVVQFAGEDRKNWTRMETFDLREIWLSVAPAQEHEDEAS